MGLRRVATPSERMSARNAIVLETDEVSITLWRSVLDGLTAAQIEEAIKIAAGAARLPPIYAHINRDGSIALATGAEPDVWPEDDMEMIDV